MKGKILIVVANILKKKGKILLVKEKEHLLKRKSWINGIFLLADWKTKV